MPQGIDLIVALWNMWHLFLNSRDNLYEFLQSPSTPMVYGAIKAYHITAGNDEMS